jgi:hypothetical protein
MPEWMSFLKPTASAGLHNRAFMFPSGEVLVQTDCREIFQEVEEATGYWETALQLPEPRRFTFTLRLRQPGERVPLPPGSTLLYHNHLYPGVPLEYFGSQEWRIFRVCGADVVAADYEGSAAWGVTAVNSSRWSQQYLYNCVFLPPVIEWLGRHGISVFHGGAVSWDDNGVIVMGPSGSGKTTAVLALILAGFNFLTDDIGLLFDGAPLRVSGLSEPINLCPDACQLFSSFRHLAPEFQGDAKRPLPWDAVDGAQTRQWCHPRLLLFPVVRPELDVALVPITREEALELILPNGMFLTGLKQGSQRFLAFLQLLETTKPMRLVLGQGMSRLPGLVKDALSTVKGSHG